ncbi:MAG: cytochrome [Bacteroidetes bacterium]|nr:cytochrome [Bacteroidota bacterium]
MKILKRILFVIAGLIVILQFIRPPRNISDSAPMNDIATRFNVPQDVQNTLRTSCYDCHSNTTRHPWYAEIQPVGWWLNSHIQDAKRELNFSEFAAYRPRRQFIKLEQIAEQVSESEMPLPSYLIIHTDARLSQERKDMLVAWTNVMRDSMKTMYPVDSLERQRR